MVQGLSQGIAPSMAGSSSGDTAALDQKIKQLEAQLQQVKQKIKGGSSNDPSIENAKKQAQQIEAQIANLRMKRNQCSKEDKNSSPPESTERNNNESIEHIGEASALKLSSEGTKKSIEQEAKGLLKAKSSDSKMGYDENKKIRVNEEVSVGKMLDVFR